MAQSDDDVLDVDDAESEVEVEAIDAGVSVRRRRRREGARPKVRAHRELKREVFRHSLEHNANMKVALRVLNDRPRTRGDCMHHEGPCPWVSCKYHLYLSVNPESGAITFNFPDKEVWEIEETCALDVADRGGTTLEEVGRLSNVTRERVRQVETKALLFVRSLPETSDLR